MALPRAKKAVEQAVETAVAVEESVVEAVKEKKARVQTPAGRVSAAKKTLDGANKKLHRFLERKAKFGDEEAKLTGAVGHAQREYNEALRALVGDQVEITFPGDKQDVDAAVDAIDAGLTPADEPAF